MWLCLSVFTFNFHTHFPSFQQQKKILADNNWKQTETQIFWRLWSRDVSHALPAMFWINRNFFFFFLQDTVHRLGGISHALSHKGGVSHRMHQAQSDCLIIFTWPLCVQSVWQQEREREKKVTVDSVPSLPSDRSPCQAGTSRPIVAMMLLNERPTCLTLSLPRRLWLQTLGNGRVTSRQLQSPWRGLPPLVPPQWNSTK